MRPQFHLQIFQDILICVHNSIYRYFRIYLYASTIPSTDISDYIYMRPQFHLQIFQDILICVHNSIYRYFRIYLYASTIPSTDISEYIYMRPQFHLQIFQNIFMRQVYTLDRKLIIFNSGFSTLKTCAFLLPKIYRNYSN